MSDNRLKVLRMLSSANKSDWKIGKSNDFIRNVSSKIGTLPADVFDKFSIDANGDKKISIVDFALMTYEMSDSDKNSLMSLYEIDSRTINDILRTADEIAEIFESQVPVIENKNDDFDEI